MNFIIVMHLHITLEASEGQGLTALLAHHLFSLMLLVIIQGAYQEVIAVGVKLAFMVLWTTAILAMLHVGQVVVEPHLLNVQTVTLEIIL